MLVLIGLVASGGRDLAAQVGRSNARILAWIRAGTLFLAMGVVLTTIAVIAAFG